MNKRKPKSRRRGRRTAGVLLLAGTLAAGAAYAARGLEFESRPDYLRHELLSLAKVDFVGLRALEANSLWERAEVPARTPLIDLDLAAIEESIASHPRVESVQATRLPPERLVIGVRERRPVAFDADTRLGIDADGERFPIDPRERAGLLPVRGEIGPALPVIEALGEFGIEVTRIEALADRGVRLELSEPALGVWLGSETRAALEHWLRLRSSGLIERHRPLEVDLRFSDQAILRGVERGES
ncbi:MAG: FtsQ-type POTRA domain-containing protein [Proteobacteria bacterium]|nr:FtsQ-type POTRA domain-containing protein [Pseudomonadota bacterium]